MNMAAKVTDCMTIALVLCAKKKEEKAKSMEQKRMKRDTTYKYTCQIAPRGECADF